jgi:hypothetical protein
MAVALFHLMNLRSRHVVYADCRKLGYKAVAVDSNGLAFVKSVKGFKSLSLDTRINPHSCTHKSARTYKEQEFSKGYFCFLVRKGENKN